MNKNEGLTDRFVRILIASLSYVIAFFWLSGFPQILIYIVGSIALITGLIGFCGLYKIFNFSTVKKGMTDPKLIVLYLITLFTTILIAGALLSIKITKNKFLEDFGRMNGFYKQTLFLIGQGKRDEAKVNYDKWVAESNKFFAKYNLYKPYVLRNDDNFNNDLEKVKSIIADNKKGVYEGDLAVTHTKLESVRPIFQDIFKRNGFSMFAITLTDFHDAMEKLIEASDLKKPADVINNYPEADSILKSIEVELNDDDVKSIRKNLDDLYNLAKESRIDELSAKAASLKNSFVKVYLIKG